MVTGKRKSGLAAEIKTRNHSITSDVNVKLGGHDSGFNPHELLEGALAACTIITGQMYADRKGYKLDSIDVTVKVISEGPESKIDCEVHYRGDLSDDEKKRLTEIINKCPIHKLLESHIQIQMTTT